MMRGMKREMDSRGEAAAKKPGEYFYIGEGKAHIAQTRTRACTHTHHARLLQVSSMGRGMESITPARMTVRQAGTRRPRGRAEIGGMWAYPPFRSVMFFFYCGS
jgi:hypothetical protein